MDWHPTFSALVVVVGLLWIAAPLAIALRPVRPRRLGTVPGDVGRMLRAIERRDVAGVVVRRRVRRG